MVDSSSIYLRTNFGNRVENATCQSQPRHWSSFDELVALLSKANRGPHLHLSRPFTRTHTCAPSDSPNMSHYVGSESLYRSATMSLIQLFIPSEVAHATVSELGGLGNVQFKDVSTYICLWAGLRRY